MISIDDYHPTNPIVANLIEKYGLQDNTIWFLDFRNYEVREMITKFSQRGFKIGSHTMTHAFLNEIPIEQTKWQVEESKKQIEKLTGKVCDWIAYPRGRFNDEVIEIVKNAGYKYGRTTRLFDEDDFRLGGCHLSYERKEYNFEDPFDYAKKSHLKHYWLHTKEILERNWLNKLEEFLKWLKGEK